jgi:hypothetical protein
MDPNELIDFIRRLMDGADELPIELRREGEKLLDTWDEMNRGNNAPRN